jgi:outer membrane protein TolC
MPSGQRSLLSVTTQGPLIMQRPAITASIVLLGLLAVQSGPYLALAQTPGDRPRVQLLLPPAVAPSPAPAGTVIPAAAPPAKPKEGEQRLPKPRPVSEPAKLASPEPEAADRPLPINLATALRLADARPLVIEAARAAVETEYGLYAQARVLWLPTVNVGVDYQHHDGGLQNLLTGTLIRGPRNQFIAGGGAQAVFALSDAIYAPLAARQLLRARSIDIQTAKNDALLSVAVAYFDVQQARGILAGTLDSVTRGRELARRVAALGKGLVPAIEVERVRTTLANLEQQAATARQDWRVSSATLARVLRLDPAAVAAPLEPPHLQVTLIPPKEPVDALIPVGLTNRPELASQQAVVQATLVRLRQERMRPLIPSLVLQTNATPDGHLGAGVVGSGTSGLTSWGGRSDWDAQVVWQFQNLGFGNCGLVLQRRGENRQALVELFRTQDQVAAEVTQAYAQVTGAAVRVQKAEAELKAAVASYDGNLKGLGQTVRTGELLVLVNRPQEVVAALQQLQQAYVDYYTSANDYNRAEFQLFRSMGYPAQGLACGSHFGGAIPVNTARPPQMAPVHAPEPCRDCPH